MIVIFKCPKCASTHWGTGKDEKGYCHHEKRAYCDFSWNRQDDWKYFKKVISFDSEEEFEQEANK